MIVVAFGENYEHSQEELVLLRIKAKADLWNFFNDISTQITNPHILTEELTKEITGAVVKILHPLFNQKEMEEETANVLQTLKVQKPKNFYNIHSSEVFNQILSKLRELKDDR